MNRTELINKIAERTELTKKDSEAALKAFTEIVTETLVDGGRVQLIGFGTFEARERAAREGRNPANGETIQIEASRTPAFKAGKEFKRALNK